MTQDHLSFRNYLTPDEIERARALASTLMQQVSPEGTEATKEMMAAVADLFARVGAAAAAERAIAWLPLKMLFADMRAHIVRHMPDEDAPRKPRRPKTGLTVHEINVLRAFVKYPEGGTLSLIERDTHLDRRSLNSGALLAVKAGHLEMQQLKANYRIYRLTDAGRQELAEYDRRRALQRQTGGPPLVVNPYIGDGRKLRYAPSGGPRIKAS
jgi:hypothetical protein